MIYYIYIILCKKNVYYTGITTDIKRRFLEHKNDKNKGAKFTKSHEPLKILIAYSTDNRSNASKLEYLIKSLTREQKDDLINNNKLFKKFFNENIDTSCFRKVSKSVINKINKDLIV